jgi:signal transduction histidine kinase
MCVQDDGIGLKPGDIEHAHGLGLRGMRERIAGLGGTLDASGERGTRIVARVPLIGAAQGGT